MSQLWFRVFNLGVRHAFRRHGQGEFEKRLEL